MNKLITPIRLIFILGVSFNGPQHGPQLQVVSNKISAATSECASVAGHFDGHAEALKRYMRHRPMQHVHSFTGSHWTPPLGNYSLRIDPSAARAAINSMMMQHVLTLLAVLMAIAMRWYYSAPIARWRRFVAFIKATKRHHQTSTRSDIIKGTHQLRLFRTLFHHEKELQLTCWPLIPIGV